MPDNFVYNKEIVKEKLVKGSQYLNSITKDRDNFINKFAKRTRRGEIANEFDSGAANFFPFLFSKTQLYKDIAYNAYNKEFVKTTGVDLYEVENISEERKKQYQSAEKELDNKIFKINLVESLFVFTLAGAILGGLEFGFIGAAIGLGAGLVFGGLSGTVTGFVDSRVEKAQNQRLFVSEVEQQAKSDGKDIANIIQIDQNTSDIKTQEGLAQNQANKVEKLEEQQKQQK